MARTYRFGAVEVRPSERQLLVEGKPAALGGRAFDVLMALIDHRDRIVTKNELLDMVWPGLVVEENNLQVQVSSLRKLLGAQSVATVPGRGYRFTLEPEIDDSAPALALPPRRHNLPAQLTSFIGRQRQIADVCETLTLMRLVTLVSVGGAGKTRLSQQVGARLLLEFPDGVWFVELAPVSDERRVPHALASVLGVKEDAGRPMIEALMRYAQGRRILVILDNCEHVLKASAELAKQLLQAGEHVRILASSREPLHIAGEAIHQVGVLDDSEAMRLFVDRTAAVQPAFEVTTQNSHHVAEICRRLDGLPLAIELAAARMRAMSVEAVSARLADCFRVLTGGRHDRAAPAADAARFHRLELRPARPAGAGAASPPRGLRRRMDAGGRGGAWPPGATSTRMRSSICSRASSTSRSSSSIATPDATACWRPCGSTRMSCSSLPARPTRSARATCATSSRSPKGAAPAHGSHAGPVARSHRRGAREPAHRRTRGATRRRAGPSWDCSSPTASSSTG
jgi:DNA-binding winged helix-turn-helix (wHTH) protein